MSNVGQWIWQYAVASVTWALALGVPAGLLLWLLVVRPEQRRLKADRERLAALRSEQRHGQSLQ